MAGALITLEALVGLSWFFLVFDGLIALSLIAVWIGAVLILVGLRLRAEEARQAWNSSSTVGLSFLLLPVFLLLLQCAPNPLFPHSIWSTTAAALNESISGHVTIDVGATLVSLCRYLTFAALVVVALGVSIDRQRAESLLFALAGSTVSFTLALLVLTPLVASAASTVTPSLQAISALGTLLCATLMFRSYQRLEIQRGQSVAISLRTHGDGVAGLIGFAVCIVAIASVGFGTMWLAVFLAMVPVAAVPMIRRIARGITGSRLAMVVLLLLVIGSIAVRLAQGSGDIAVRAALSADSSQIGLAQRMLSDANWLGSGAGTYSSLVPLYRTFDDPQQVMVPPTTAANLAIVMGRSVLGLFMLAGLGLAVLLFDRALRRGRDLFYPALGAGCALLITFEIFIDGNLLGMTVPIISSATMGLALGQSLSTRSPQ